MRNGYAEPWAYGYLPGQDLADNARPVRHRDVDRHPAGSHAGRGSRRG